MKKANRPLATGYSQAGKKETTGYWPDKEVLSSGQLPVACLSYQTPYKQVPL